MRKDRSLFPALLFMLLCAPVFAQWDTLALPFRTLTIKDGLSQGMVNCITQDHEGFMWFATKDGLNRYDGYSFKVFRHDALDSTSLNNSFVVTLLEDREGRLWVGTATGLDLFEPNTETFEHFPLRGTPADGSLVEVITQDLSGDLWIGTMKGLVKITFNGSTTNSVDHRALRDFRITHFFSQKVIAHADRKGRIWGHEENRMFFRIVPDHGGKDRVDTVRWDRPEQVSDVDRFEAIMVEDTVRDKMYALHEFGVAEVDADDAVIRTLYEGPPNDLTLSHTVMTVDQTGSIWIPGRTGLFRFDPGSARLTRLNARDPNLQRMTENVVYTYLDRNGLLWIGTTGYGILQYDPRIERFHNHPDQSMNGMSRTIDDKVLVGRTNYFMSVFDPATGRYSLEVLHHKYDDHPALEGYNPWAMYTLQAKDGSYWLSKGGLIRYYPAQDVLQRFMPSDAPDRNELIHEYCFPLHLDTRGRVWFGWKTAFWRFDHETHAFTSFTYPIPAVREAYEFLQVIHEDDDGILWLGTLRGLLRFDPGDTSWKHYEHDGADPATLAVDVIFSIEPDPADPQVLWIGTNGGGLNRFDKATGKVTRYSTAQGLPNDVVYGVLSDASGNLWMSTNKGLSRFTPSTNTFRNFDESYGLQSDEFNRYAYCKLNDGTLFFGGVNGFNYFKPEELKDDPRPSKIHITGIKLINRSVQFGKDDALLRSPVYLSDDMSIPYSENMVTFEFASMEFAAPELHRYQYKLDGFDPDWIMAGTANSAIYTNLDPGTYTFHVRGDNRDGIWDTEGTSFRLVVLPPWWKTWWAYVIYVLVAAGSLLLYIRLRTAGLQKQKRILEVTVAERTEALIHEKEEADAQRRRAEHSERIKQQFLANMSHEIRTPMNAIMGMTSSLRRNERLPAQEKYLEAIAESSSNLLVILNDILDIGKLEAGKIEIEQVTMHPRDVIRQVMDILHHKAEEKGLRSEWKVDADVPETVMGDPTRLGQIMLNLAGNAIKFTERGSVTIRVGCSADPSARPDWIALVINVIDTGIGIRDDRKSSIFEEFTQADNETSRKYGGSGLGLTITKRLVELQHGSITMESTQGTGSTFTVEIPYALPTAGTSEIAQESGPTIRYLRNLRILLAEDNEFNVMVAQDELTDAIPGAIVDVAGNGRIAVEMLQAGTYDLVLMDIQMPEMNGFDATRAIRALEGDNSRIPIIAMTANVLKTEVDKCMEAGMNAFVPKPFKREQLLKALQEVLSNQRPTR